MYIGINIFYRNINKLWIFISPVYAYAWDDLMGESTEDLVEAAIGLAKNKDDFPFSCPLWRKA